MIAKTIPEWRCFHCGDTFTEATSASHRHISFDPPRSNCRPTKDTRRDTISRRLWVVAQSCGDQSNIEFEQMLAEPQNDFLKRIIFRETEAILAALHQPPAAQPVAWGERINGRIVCVRLDKSGFCTEPLYASPPAAQTIREAVENIACDPETRGNANVYHGRWKEFAYQLVDMARAALAASDSEKEKK